MEKITPIQKLEQYFLETQQQYNPNEIGEILVELRREEKLLVNKAYTEGVTYALKAVMGHNLPERNYYEENYGK